MTISEISTDVVSLVPASEETLYAPAAAGGAVVIVNIGDMAATDEFILRHWVSFTVDGLCCVGSKTIEKGTTTDDTWSGVAGTVDTNGWQSWPLGFGNNGGLVTIESTSGSYDIEFIVLDLGGPTG